MKILTSEPKKLEQALDQFEKLAMVVLPQIGRKVEYNNGFWLVGQNTAGDDSDGRTSLRWDNIRYDEGQDLHYIKNVMYAPGYRPEYLVMIQQIINDLELIEDDNFTPTEEDEKPNNINKEP